MSELEVITACENVCRDYFWIAQVDPRVVQGLLTVAAALIAALTALGIAVRIYPIQKRKDQEFQVQAETRAVYAEAIATMGDYFGIVCRSPKYLKENTEDVRAAFIKVVHHQSLLRLYASVQVNFAVDTFVDAIEDLRKIKLDSSLEEEDPEEWRTQRVEKNNNCRGAREGMVAAMRLHLLQPPTDIEFLETVEKSGK